MTGEIAPGAVLRQEKLSEQFGVSRTPIREALRRLSAGGLVTFLPNRGVRVRTLSREELHRPFSSAPSSRASRPSSPCRGSPPSELAAARGGRRAIHRADGCARGGASATRSCRAEWMRANHAFHDVVYAAAAAPYVERPRRARAGRSWARRRGAQAPRSTSLYARNDLEHRAIREAIAARSAGARGRSHGSTCSTPASCCWRSSSRSPGGAAAARGPSSRCPCPALSKSTSTASPS